MNRYKFLFKPAFFIFSLLFATWLVIRVERLQPSDMGRYQKLFEGPEQQTGLSEVYIREYLNTLYEDHRSGKIDREILLMEVERFLEKLRDTKNSTAATDQ